LRVIIMSNLTADASPDSAEILSLRCYRVWLTRDTALPNVKRFCVRVSPNALSASFGVKIGLAH
jgi:hypothetical protein